MRRYTFEYEVTTGIDDSFLSSGTVIVEATNQNNAEVLGRRRVQETDRYCDASMDPVITLNLESVEETIDVSAEPGSNLQASQGAVSY